VKDGRVWQTIDNNKETKKSPLHSLPLIGSLIGPIADFWNENLYIIKIIGLLLVLVLIRGSVFGAITFVFHFIYLILTMCFVRIGMYLYAVLNWIVYDILYLYLVDW
jgi:hypothetical protein